MSQGPNLVLEWLSKLNLAQYVEAFIDNGYDDLEVCKQIGEPDLDAIGVNIQYHRHRLLAAVHKLKDEDQRNAPGYYFTLEPLDPSNRNHSLLSNREDDLQTLRSKLHTTGIHEATCPGNHNLRFTDCKDFVTYPKLKLKVLLRDKLAKDGINLGEAPYTRKTSFVLRADVVQIAGANCIACFCANGHIMTLSLPSLRPLLDVNYLPLTDMRIARTFCFSNLGQALYLTSPTEIQRITYSQETCDNRQEMLSELFTPVETPEAPNRGFFKGLFGGGAQSLDREDLFGETVAGKASRSLAQHIPGPGGMEGMKGAASGVVGDLARARIALDERGQKLGELEDRTAAMMASAESFSKHAHDMMLKYKDKKWYQL